ncbi:MAG TPA: class I SAM-dependent methyltransferase [Thermoplasmata archaeon]|nr:class I SAM-dependent methyltransferase [Thermoplasmata archaeon]
MSVAARTRGGAPSLAASGRGLGSEEPLSLELILPGRNVPLGFVRNGNVVYLVGGDRSARWPVELLRQGYALLSISDRTAGGSAELITDPLERQGTLDRFREKYGPEQYARWYGDPARVLRIRLGAPQPPTDGGERYYGWLASEFDNIADDYDRHILGNRMNRLLRDRSLTELRRAFGRAPRLLEIGCGSGMETLPLLVEGHEVFCVDISERMLEVVRQKARKEGVFERLQTAQLAAAALPRFLEQVGPASFDGAYSTYGAMNCEADLGPIPPALHELLRPGGRFVAGVYNRWCAFELLGYSLTGRFDRAFGRAGRPVRVGSSRFCVDVYAHSPPAFERTFAPWFVRERLAAAPVLLPPSDLVAYAERFRRHFAALDHWDQAVAERWPFSLLGDHFLLTLRSEKLGPAAA